MSPSLDQRPFDVDLPTSCKSRLDRNLRTAAVVTDGTISWFELASTHRASSAAYDRHQDQAVGMGVTARSFTRHRLYYPDRPRATRRQISDDGAIPKRSRSPESKLATSGRCSAT